MFEQSSETTALMADEATEATVSTHAPGYLGDAFYPTLQSDTFQIGPDQVKVETGRVARSASGSVTLQIQDTVIMVTGTVSEKPREGIDFFPLLVDFEEKMYSVGRLPGGYLKREGRPSDKAVLSSRLIDRPIRPLFPEGYRNDVQIVAVPQSVDNIIIPDVYCIFGASLALELAGAPFMGPVGAVRVGLLDGELIINPTYEELERSELDLVVAGTEDSIMMVEAGAKFVPEETLLEALDYAHEEIRKQVEFQRQFVQKCGVEKKEFVPPYDASSFQAYVDSLIGQEIETAYHNFDKNARKALLDAAKEKLKSTIALLEESHEVVQFLESNGKDRVGDAFKALEKKTMRAMILKEGVRADGRKAEEIRPIHCEVGRLPRVHGSGLFTRGSTQVLSICTLGAPGDAQKLDGVDPATEKRWMHHYAFPGFSTGEVRPMRGPGRREVGHGALAERAIAPVLPPKEKFPYTLRVNSDVLESNGSTSMASTCGAILALMDAGVPIQEPVGGIAMGLIKENDQYVVLSDIQGIEDFLGDMDFKVTGTRDGVTALQMDIKIRGISIDIMRIALEQARLGRLHILDKMALTIQQPRTELSKWAPRILTMKIDTDMIGTVIGPGGKMIRSIIEETGATIDIEDDGTVTITSVSGDGGERALAIVQRLTQKLEPGMLSVGKVVRILPIGAFVELGPGRDGLVHISQLVNRRVNSVEDVLNVGDEVLVKIVDIDDRGRVNLTMKGVTDEEREINGFPPLETLTAHLPPAPERPERDDRGPGGGGGDRRGGGGGRPFNRGGGDRGGGGRRY
ncbi:MAG: polyribonucleotide nucleotidyltransferase [Candidatus Melainabacteria bacterium]|nr:polyribonucleotide nucleotidyltransferase [Candidatus Melainabacteria bacterium]